MALPQRYQKNKVGMALPKDSPYHDLVNHYILMMIESGIINKILQSAKPPEQECGYETGSPLGFKNCITPFLVLIGGIGLTFSLLLLEVVIFKHKLQKEKKDEEDHGHDSKEPEVEEPKPRPCTQMDHPRDYEVIVI